MPTVAREIDALGGTFDGYADDRGGQYAPAYIDGYNAGHLNALDAAEPIAENADALIEELIELVEDMLDGNRKLETWAIQARQTITNVKHRRAQ